MKQITLFIMLSIMSNVLHAEDLSSLQGAQGQILMLVVFLAIFYFIIVRPQNKRNKEHKKLIDNLSKGDEVLTSGGVLGKIVNTNKNFVSVEISNNVVVRMKRHSIIKAYPKGTMESI